MKKTYPYIFVIVILVALLGLVLYLGFSGYLFSVSLNALSTDLPIGKVSEVTLLPNETSVLTFTIDGDYLPGEKLDSVVQIRAGDDCDNVRVRVKGVFSQGLEADFEASNNFVKATDGYFYLTEPLAGGNKVTFSKSVILPSALANDNYILSIIVENIDAMKENIWGDYEIA